MFASEAIIVASTRKVVVHVEFAGAPRLLMTTALDTVSLTSPDRTR